MIRAALTILIITLLGTAVVRGQAPDHPADLESLRRHALDANAGIQAARAQLEAGEARADGAGAWPDPRVGLGWMISPVETRVGPQRQVVSVSQTLPWFGTLGARQEQARHEASVLAAELRGLELTVLAQVDAAWAEAAWLEVATAATREHLMLLTSWEEVARSRYAAGRGEYADVVRAQVEMGILESRFRELEDRGPVLRATLAEAVGLDALPEGWRVGDLPDTLPELDGIVLSEAASPDLAALDLASDAARSGAALAGLKGRPDLTVGLDWIRTDPATADVPDSGRDPLVARLSFNLPLWRGAVDAGRRAAVARVEEVGHRRLQRRRSLEADLADALFRHRDAARRLDLYDGELVPRSEQALSAVHAAYEAGRAGFGDVLDVQRQWLEFTTAAARAAADGVIQQARIERITGTTLPRSER